MGCGIGAGVELSKYDRYVQTFEITVNREILQYLPAIYRPRILKAINDSLYERVPKEKKDEVNKVDDKTFQQELDKIPEYVSALKVKFNTNFFQLLVELQKIHETYLAIVPADKREAVRQKIIESLKDLLVNGLEEVHDEKILAEFLNKIAVKYSIEEMKKEFPF